VLPSTRTGTLLQTLLVEDGDPSHPQTAERDIRWVAGWIDIAAALGAQNMRVIAGKQQPSDENLGAFRGTSCLAGRAGGRAAAFAYRHRKLVRPACRAEGDELAA
jgi:sugar phosphate isomerase/epimerase